MRVEERSDGSSLRRKQSELRAPKIAAEPLGDCRSEIEWGFHNQWGFVATVRASFHFSYKPTPKSVDRPHLKSSDYSGSLPDTR